MVDNLNWTEEQMAVIQSKASARLLVDAGPGTGKTATACARVAWLIENEGIEPHQILMTSFTNAAVHEITSRISSYLKDPSKAFGIKISTLDSFSWNLRNGFTNGELERGGYIENIQNAADLIELDENVQEYVKSIEHFLIDEAQDVTGPRASLILNIVKCLPKTSGVSIFSDEAQSIYGFTEDENPEFYGNTLPQEIKASEELLSTFMVFSLDQVHRTKDEKLKKLFHDGRQKLIAIDDIPVDELYREVRDLVVSTHHGEVSSAYEMLVKNEQQEELKSSDFLLFRKRSEALQTIHYLSTRNYRVRLSGFPVAIHPWIGRCFWDFTADKLTESEFSELYSKRISPESPAEIEEKWLELRKEVGTEGNRISIRRLSNLLSRPNPPRSFSSQDYGLAGPIIGTIHAAKGREANRVFLFVPNKPNFVRMAENELHEELLEEARILYVGATRAKDTLVISDTSTGYRKTGNVGFLRRAYSIKPTRENQVAIEIGRKEDVTAEQLVGLRTFIDKAAAWEAQEALWVRRDSPTPLKGESFKETNYVYHVSLDYNFTNVHYEDSHKEYKYERKLFDLAKQFNSDIFDVGKIIGANLRPPQRFSKFYSIGSRTLAVATDDPARELLHEPWKESGFMLAPMLIGFPDIYLKKYGAKRT